MMELVDVHFLGTQDFQKTYDAMRKFTAHRTHATPDEIWVLEHPQVFTLGLAGDSKHILKPITEIPLVQIDRGGQITYHGPGQIVVYLLLDLKRLGIFVKEFVRRIEEAVIQTLRHYEILAERHVGAPGIYVGQEHAEHGGAKIAALGLKVTKHCTYHGLALNVQMDLQPFQTINPCGYSGLEVVDMATLGVTVEQEEVGQRLVRELQTHLYARL